MIGYFFRLIRPLHIAMLLAIAVVLGLVFHENIASALIRGNNIGYFTGNTYTGPGNKVIRGASGATGDGIPSWVNTKAELITFIENTHNSGNNNDKIGADYIIQTMRGTDDSGDYDYSRPDAADIADWKVKLNNPKVVYYNSELMTYSINTKTVPGGVDSGVRDVVNYSEPVVKASIVLRVDGRVVYVIKRDCGNPLGALPGLPPPEEEIELKSNICRPIRFTATPDPAMDNNRPPGYVPLTVYSRDASGSYYRPLGTYTGGSVSIDATQTHTTGDVYAIWNSIPSYINGWVPRMEVVPGSDPIAWQYTGIDDPTYAPAREFNTGAIGPCYNYKLTASSDSSALLEAGQSGTVSPRVSSAKYDPSVPHTKSRPSTWQITQLKYNPGNLVDTTLDNTNDASNPAAYFSGDADEVTTVASGSNVVFDTSGNIISGGGAPSYTLNVENEPAGTKFCYAFSVRDAAGVDVSGGDNRWNHSSFSKSKNCFIVIKKPKVQIWGSDLISGGSVQTSQSIKGGKTFGSWVEYSIYSLGLTNGMASASAFYNLDGFSGTTTDSYSRLSFSNTGQSSLGLCKDTPQVGCYYSAAPKKPAIKDAFKSGATISGSVSVSSLITAGSDIFSGTGNISIDGGVVPKGKTIIINAPNANITINSNIRYEDGPFDNINQIPQMVIIASAIDIKDSVTNIDSWLIANTNGNSYINTCTSVSPTADLTSLICPNLLTINGPVQTSKLYLRRTAGDSGTNEPAEIFNLRADAYLWSISRSRTTERIRTVYTSSLPARL